MSPDDSQIRAKCLELATIIAKRDGDSSVNNVVEIAKLFYNWVNNNPEPASEVATPKKRRGVERQAE